MYTYDQAQEACKEHKHLVGSQLRRGWRITGVIEAVIVAPLDGINQYKFLKDYKITGNAAQSLKFYKGILHTVLLVVRSQQCATDVFTLNLESYLEDHPLEFSKGGGRVLALEY